MTSLVDLEGDTVPFSFLGIQERYEKANYIIVGVPYDATSSFMPGSREGPLSIIQASRYLDPYDIELGCVPAEAGIHTIPELSVLEAKPEAMVDKVERAVSKILRDGKTPILLGGEHTISLGGVLGSRDLVDIYVVLDAHADFYDLYGGRKISHATVSRRIIELVDEVVIYGVRTLGWEEKEELEKHEGVTLAYRYDDPSDLMDLIEGNRIYLSLDMDVLDPTLLPCLGTPEPDGLSYREVIELLRNIIGKSEVVAMDFVEFSPCSNMRSDAYTVAKLVYKSVGYHALHSGKYNLGCRSYE